MRMDVKGSHVSMYFESYHDLIDSTWSQPGLKDFRVWLETTEFRGGLSGPDEVLKVAREGLPSEGIKAMRIADEAVKDIDLEYGLPTFSAYYDVTGSDVDVARFLSGEPENMIAYTLVDTPKVGRVITLVVSLAVPHRVSAGQINRRGTDIMALVFALERIGFQVEVIGNVQIAGERSPKTGSITIPLKRAGESLDAGRLMFAFTHAAFARGVLCSAMHLLPGAFRKSLGIGRYYGLATRKPSKDGFPDGAIFIEPIHSGWTVETFVTDNLKALGLI